MKVVLESMTGTRYPVDVGDSVGSLKEFKEKIEKALFIPKPRQILYYRGNILRSDADLLDVKHGSLIKFRVAGEYPDHSPDPAPTPIPRRRRVLDAELMNLQLATPSETIVVKASGGDTIRQLKDYIESIEGTPADHILITTHEDAGSGMEIPDHKRLREYATSLESGLTVEFLSFEAEPRKGTLTVVSLPSSPPSSPPRKKSRLSAMSSASSSSSTPPAVDADEIRLELQYQWKSVTPAPVEVRGSDMVGELRTRLEEMHFKVPGNREYCFFHKLLLLDEDRSFASQNVKNGDVVYICSPGLTRIGY